jgi:hypothetical protein
VCGADAQRELALRVLRQLNWTEHEGMGNKARWGLPLTESTVESAALPRAAALISFAAFVAIDPRGRAAYTWHCGRFSTGSIHGRPIRNGAEAPGCVRRCAVLFCFPLRFVRVEVAPGSFVVQALPQALLPPRHLTLRGPSQWQRRPSRLCCNLCHQHRNRFPPAPSVGAGGSVRRVGIEAMRRGTAAAAAPEARPLADDVEPCTDQLCFQPPAPSGALR